MSRLPCPIAAILVAGSLGVVKLLAQQPFEVVVGTLTEDRDGWSLLRSRGSEVAEFMTTQFGPTGVVQDRVLTIRGISEITSDVLASIDIFHVVFGSQHFVSIPVPFLSADEITALEQHVQRGLALLVFVNLDGSDAGNSMASSRANRLLREFEITAVLCCGRQPSGEAFPTDAMPNRIRHGPFGTVERVRWDLNQHNNLHVSNTSSATAIVSGVGFGVVGEAFNEVVLWAGPGQVLAFADYFNS